MLEHGYIGEGKAVQECKPDYEVQIKACNNELTKNQNFQTAIFDYVGNVRLRDKMAELVGELVSEERLIRVRKGELISQQERESTD